MILKIFLVLVVQAQWTNGQCGDNCQLNYPPKQNLKLNLQVESSDENGKFSYPGSTTNAYGACITNSDGSSSYEASTEDYTVIVTKSKRKSEYINCGGPNFLPGYVPSPRCEREKIEITLPVQFLQDLNNGKFVNTDINWIVLLGLDKIFTPTQSPPGFNPNYGPSEPIRITVPLSIAKYVVHMLIESQLYGKHCDGGDGPGGGGNGGDNNNGPDGDGSGGVTIFPPTPTLPNLTTIIPPVFPNPATKWETLLDVINPNGWIKIPNWMGFQIYMNGVRLDGSPMTFGDWKTLITNGLKWPVSNIPFISGWKLVQNTVNNNQFWINIVDHYGTPIHVNKWPTIIVDTVAGSVIDSLQMYPAMGMLTLILMPPRELNWTTPYYHLPTPDIERWNTIIHKINPHEWVKLEISPGVFRLVNIVKDDSSPLSPLELETLVNLGFTSPWDNLSNIPPTSPPGFKLIIENGSQKRYWLLILTPAGVHVPSPDWLTSLKAVVNLGPNPPKLSVTVNPNGNPSWPGITPTYNPQIKWPNEVLLINPNGWFKGALPNGITVYINFVFENGNPLTPEDIIKIFNRPLINIWLNAVDDNWRNPGWKVVQTYLGQSVYLNLLYENGSPVEPKNWYDIITNLLKTEIVPGNYLTPAIRYVVTVPYPNGPLQWKPLTHHPKIFLVTIVDRDGKPYNPNGWQWIVDKFSNTYLINPVIDNCTPWIRKNFNPVSDGRANTVWIINTDQYNVPVSNKWPRWMDSAGNEYWMEAVDDKMHPQDVTTLWERILSDSSKVFWKNYYDFNKTPLLEHGWQQVYHPVLKQYVCLNSFTNQGKALFLEFKQQFVDFRSNTYIVNYVTRYGIQADRPVDATFVYNVDAPVNWIDLPDIFVVPGNPWKPLNETVLLPNPGIPPATSIPIPKNDLDAITYFPETGKEPPTPKPTYYPHPEVNANIVKWEQLLDVINPNYWIEAETPVGRYYVNGVLDSAIPMTVKNWLDLITNGFVSIWLERTDPNGKLFNPIGWKFIQDILLKQIYLINIIDERGYPVSPKQWPTIICEPVLKPCLANRPSFWTIYLPPCSNPVYLKPVWPVGIDTERWDKIFYKINPDGWYKLNVDEPVCINIVKDDSYPPEWSELVSLRQNGFTSPWDNKLHLANKSEPYGFKLIYENHNYNRFYVLVVMCNGQSVPTHQWPKWIGEIITLGPRQPTISLQLNVTGQPEWPDRLGNPNTILKWETNLLEINPRGWIQLKTPANEIIYFNFVDEDGKPLTPSQIVKIFSNPWYTQWLHYINSTEWNSYGWKEVDDYLGNKYYINIIISTGYLVSPIRWAPLIIDLFNKGIITPDLTIPSIRYEIGYDPTTQKPKWEVLKTNPMAYFVTIVDEQGTPYNPNGIQQIVDKFSNVYYINPIREDTTPFAKEVFRVTTTPEGTKHWVIRVDGYNNPISLQWPRFTDTNMNSYWLYATTTQYQQADITREWTTIIHDSKDMYWRNWYDFKGFPLFQKGWQVVYNPIRGHNVFLNILTNGLKQIYLHLMKITSDARGNIYLVNNVNPQGETVQPPIDITLTTKPELKIPPFFVLPNKPWINVTQVISPEVPKEDLTEDVLVPPEAQTDRNNTVVRPTEPNGEVKYGDKLIIINPNRWLTITYNDMIVYVNIINEDASPVVNIEISTLLRNGWTSNWLDKSDNPAGWKLIIENTTGKRYFINVIYNNGIQIAPREWPRILNPVIIQPLLKSGTHYYKTLTKRTTPDTTTTWEIDHSPVGFDTLRWQLLLNVINRDGWFLATLNNIDYLISIVKDDGSVLSTLEITSLISNNWNSPWSHYTGPDKRGWKLIIENNILKRYWFHCFQKDLPLDGSIMTQLTPGLLGILLQTNVSVGAVTLGPSGDPIFEVLPNGVEISRFLKWPELEKVIEINPNGWMRIELERNIIYLNFVDENGNGIAPSDLKLIFTNSWSSPFITATEESLPKGTWSQNGWKVFSDHLGNELFVNILYSTGSQVNPKLWYEVIKQLISTDFTDNPPIPPKFVIRVDTALQFSWKELDEGANVYYVTIVDLHGVPFNPNGWHKIIDKRNNIYILNPVDIRGTPIVKNIFEMKPNSLGKSEWVIMKNWNTPISHSWSEFNDSVNIFRIYAVTQKTGFQVDITENVQEILRNCIDIAWINSVDANGYSLFPHGWPVVFNPHTNQNVFLNALAENQNPVYPELFQRFTDYQGNLYFINKYNIMGQKVSSAFSITLPPGTAVYVEFPEQLVIPKNPFAGLLSVITVNPQISLAVVVEDLQLLGFVQKIGIEGADFYIDLKGIIWLIPKAPHGVIYTEAQMKELAIRHNQPVFTPEDNDDPKTQHEIVLDPSTGNIVVIPRITVETGISISIATRVDLQKLISFYGKVFLYHNQLIIEGETKLIRDGRGNLVEIPVGQWEWSPAELQILINRPGVVIFRPGEIYTKVQIHIDTMGNLYDIPLHPNGNTWSPADADLLAAVVGLKIFSQSDVLSNYNSQIVTDGQQILYIPNHPRRQWTSAEISILIKTISKVYLTPGVPYSKVIYEFDNFTGYIYVIPKYPREGEWPAHLINVIMKYYRKVYLKPGDQWDINNSLQITDQFKRRYKIPNVKVHKDYLPRIKAFYGILIQDMPCKGPPSHKRLQDVDNTDLPGRPSDISPEDFIRWLQKCGWTSWQFHILNDENKTIQLVYIGAMGNPVVVTREPGVEISPGTIHLVTQPTQMVSVGQYGGSSMTFETGDPVVVSTGQIIMHQGSKYREGKPINIQQKGNNNPLLISGVDAELKPIQDNQISETMTPDPSQKTEPKAE